MPETTDSPDLLAATGLNDPGSPWNLNGLLQTGVNIGSQALQQALSDQTPLSASATNGNGVPAAAPPAAASAPAKTNWLPLAIVAAIAAVVLLFLFKK